MSATERCALCESAPGEGWGDSQVTHCRTCHATWRHSTNTIHCLRCHRTFGSPQQLDRHNDSGEGSCRDPLRVGLVPNRNAYGVDVWRTVKTTVEPVVIDIESEQL